MVLAVGLATPASAQERSGMAKRLRKLGRGLANLATSPIELVRTPERVALRDGYVAGLTVGVLQGIWRTLMREGIGAFEVLTFYAAIPRDFAPLIRPEFLLTSEPMVWEEEP
jgi:putative exosortase-associated protein (TIGR04073 family)